MAKQTLGRVIPVFKGDYDSSVSYEHLDIVVYDGSTYIAIIDTINNVPTNEEFWALLVKRPIKGIDYFTEEEIEQIVAEITEKANSVFNQNVDEKTNAFNENALSKTTDFNTNATNKTTSFDAHVTKQTTTFDNHVADKTTEFDNNTTQKTTDFNTNAVNQTSTFNTNATSKTNDFDTNAGNQTSTFNENVLAKTESYNTNATDKLETYNINAQNQLNAYNASAEELLNYAENMDNIVAKSEASGELVQVDDALDYKLLGVEVEATEVSKQETTTGKNLCGIPNQTLTSNGVDIVIEKGLITLNGSVTESNVVYLEPSKSISINGDYSFNHIFISGACNKVSDVLYSNANIRKKTDKSVISASALSLAGINKSVNFSITENTEIIFGIYLVEGNTFDNYSFKIQLIKGTSSDYNYEPYTGGQASPNPDYPQEIETIKEITLKVQQGEEIQSVSIDLQGNEIVKLSDDIKDKLVIDKKGNISLIKNTKKIILDGTRNWIKNISATTDNGYTEYAISLLDMKENSLLLCNKLQVGTNYNSQKEQIRTRLEDLRLYLNVALSRLETDSATNIKKFLSENNVTVYYALATTETISLGNLSSLIKTYEGYNNIWIESNLGTTIDVVYAQDLKLKHDKEISSLQSQIDELKTLLSSTETSAMLLDNLENDLVEEV